MGEAMFKSLRSEIDATMQRDPAARSRLEVVLCYPGFQAIMLYRLANALWRHRWYLFGRWISAIGRVVTGIEIHPGATIGERFFIDHGMGVVIGETAEIGNDVTLYQGVTLGGTGKESGKRHPTIGNDVVIGCGARVLGSITIGNDVRIGAGSVVVNDVPDDCTVVGVPARVVREGGRKPVDAPLAHGAIPDPVLRQIEALEERVRRLEGDDETRS